MTPINHPLPRVELVAMAYELPEGFPPGAVIPAPGFGWVRLNEVGNEEARFGPWAEKDAAYNDLCTNPANYHCAVRDLT